MAVPVSAKTVPVWFILTDHDAADGNVLENRLRKFARALDEEGCPQDVVSFASSLHSYVHLTSRAVRNPVCPDWRRSGSHGIPEKTGQQSERDTTESS